MVVFVAKQAVDTRDLSELGLFSNFKKLTRKHEGKSFDASKGDVDMHVDGKNMVFILKKPVSGTVHSISVKDGGVQQYSVDDLHLKLNKMQKFFSGNFEPNLFAGADKVTGSSFGDNLSTFDRADKVSAGAGNDKVVTGAGADTLYGQAGNDIMVGGKGNDFLDGGTGSNSLTGSSGKDSFQFDSQLSASNYASITDFTRGNDTIELENSVFPGLGGKGNLPGAKFVLSTDYAGQKNVVIYDKATGVLSYELSSGVLADAIKFGDVSAGLNLSKGDFLIV
jgi:Ca2+-binding RTX toxin-like protein